MAIATMKPFSECRNPRTQEKAIDDFKDAVAICGMTMLGEYFSRKYEVRLQCPKGHVVLLTPTSVIDAAHNGTVCCPVCRKEALLLEKVGGESAMSDRKRRGDELRAAAKGQLPTERTRLFAVAAVVCDLMSGREAGKKFGVSEGALRGWVADYNRTGLSALRLLVWPDADPVAALTAFVERGIDRVGREKVEAVRDVLDGKDLKAVAEATGINTHRLENMVRGYAREGASFIPKYNKR